MRRLCTGGCGDTTIKGGRCPECARSYERTIDRAGAAVYSTKRWRTTRRRKLHLNPICELCDSAIAEEVHHDPPLAEGGDPFHLDGLVSTCKPCHSRETRREQIQGGWGGSSFDSGQRNHRRLAPGARLQKSNLAKP